MMFLLQPGRLGQLAQSRLADLKTDLSSRQSGKHARPVRFGPNYARRGGQFAKTAIRFDFKPILAEVAGARSRQEAAAFSLYHAPLPARWARTETEGAHLRESTPSGTTPLVVAHGAFNRAFLARVFGLPIEAFVDEGGRFDFVNCECAEIEWLEPPVTGGDTAAPPMLRWRRRHPRESAWSTTADEQAAGAWWLAGEDAREL